MSGPDHEFFVADPDCRRFTFGIVSGVCGGRGARFLAFDTTLVCSSRHDLSPRARTIASASGQRASDSLHCCPAVPSPSLKGATGGYRNSVSSAHSSPGEYAYTLEIRSGVEWASPPSDRNNSDSGSRRLKQTLSVKERLKGTLPVATRLRYPLEKPVCWCSQSRVYLVNSGCCGIVHPLKATDNNGLCSKLASMSREIGRACSQPALTTWRAWML